MRILIVDDDMAVVEEIRDSVNWEKIGITDVVCTNYVESAKQLLLQNETDIIVSDIEMPGETGLELLRWYREKGMQGKFLLLTCHENFTYAAEAVRYHAEEYLLKPFNLEMMEFVLQKLVCEIHKEQKEKQSNIYEQWALQNMNEISLAFWTGLLTGRISCTESNLRKELRIRNLPFGQEQLYRIIVSRVTNIENDLEQYGRETTLFILENLHAEIICGRPENDRVLYFEYRDDISFVTICDEEEAGSLKEKCLSLIQKVSALLSSTLTCCISNICSLAEIYETYHRVTECVARNVIFYGQTFMENQIISASDEHQPVLQLAQMEEYLKNQNRLGFMNYLKQELNIKISLRMLDDEMLKCMCREVQQAVYGYLARQGIQVTQLLGDGDSVSITEKAEQSVIDMLHWVNYLLDRIFAYEEEVQRSKDIIDRINQYVHEHYKESIGRNEIGSAFYLVPEYLAKMYKKKTGISLKDYIHEYRIEQAKQLLKNENMRVSDIAAETGFDNYSYFSTLFKKYTGMTPNDYRKSYLEKIKTGI